MEVNLYSAIYKNQRIYFPMTMCPACNTVAPPFGYTCENKKVTIDNFQDVDELAQVYNSCMEEFSE